MSWQEIDEFPRYEVSTAGEVRNALTGRVLAPKRNQYGNVFVGLMDDSGQQQRSVALLVAQAFLPRDRAEFDTPINRDGDRYNNAVDNLLWRPRWFAVKYNNQFKRPYANPINKPIMDLATGKTWEHSWDCALDNGLLEKDLVLSILNRTYVFPTYQQFAMAD